MISSSRIAKTLLQLATDESYDTQRVLDLFLTYCKNNDLLFQLPNIIRHLEHEYEQKRRQETLVITSAYDIEPELLSYIRSSINAPEHAPIVKEIQDDLIGGFTAEYEGIVHDASVQSQLHRLHQTLLTTK